MVINHHRLTVRDVGAASVARCEKCSRVHKVQTTTREILSSVCVCVCKLFVYGFLFIHAYTGVYRHVCFCSVCVFSLRHKTCPTVSSHEHQPNYYWKA